MDAMKAALFQAGLVSDKDVKRIAAADKKAKAKRIIEDKAAMRTNVAMSRIPTGLASEMTDWMEKTGIVIPIKVLEKWGTMRADEGVGVVVREWTSWISAYADVGKQMSG